MDSWRPKKKRNLPFPHRRLLTSRRPHMGPHRLMQEKVPEDGGALNVIGISVSKLREQSLINRVQQEASMTQYGGSDSHVTAAQTSGWRLKPVPAHEVPVICSYSRPLHITLRGRPLVASCTQAQHFVRHFGRTLPPADSRSWWNYRFATSTILSRNSEKTQRASHGMVGREPHPHLVTIQGPQDVHTASTKDPSNPDPDGVNNSARKSGRKQKYGPPGGCSGHALSILPSHTESGAQVMSPEPWPSAHTPEEQEMSITVPLLPKVHQWGP